MIYRDFKGKKLSQLGMGCMRLPLNSGSDADINEKETEQMVAYAMEHGVNYYDTAWGYHDERSESVMGRILAGYPRDSFYLASKFPGYDLSNMPKVREIFEKQLEKCRVDHFDFYLFHNVCEMNIDEYLDPKYGILDYLLEQKKNGRIKYLGFSVHGAIDVMERFLDAYGEHMEFCQVQLNYVDWDFQDAKLKVEMLKERDIPLWVMEPLRGGMLAKLPEKASARLRETDSGRDDVTWAYRYLQSFPETTVVLTGASSFEQLKQNIEVFETEEPLTEKEIETLYDIAKEMTEGVPCTACRYCTSHCPQGIDIPGLIKLYNEHVYTGGGFIAPFAVAALPEDKRPSACTGCRSCEAVCPQQIKVADILADFTEKLKEA